MSIYDNPATLSKALGKASKKITSVTFEFPGFWEIKTKQDTYCLGDNNETIGWSNVPCVESFEMADTSEFTAPEVIALAFAKWLEKVEGN